MSPLLVVGILVTLTHVFGDVSHVLQDTNPREINQLAEPGHYWWMANDSPIKKAHDYFKKCQLKGNCITSNKVQNKQPNFGDNPFLNANSDVKQTTSSGVSYDKNPFLSGIIAANGAAIPKNTGFIGVQPSKPFSTVHPLEKNLNDEVCQGSGYICVEKRLCLNGIVNNNGEGLVQARSSVQYCQKHIEVCCRLPNPTNPTNSNTDVDDYDDYEERKLVLPPLDASGSLPSETEERRNISRLLVPAWANKLRTPERTATLLRDYGPHVYFLSGDTDGFGTAKPARDTSAVENSVYPRQTVDYSNSNFGDDVRFGSTIKGPAYLPPVGGPTPPSRPADLETPKYSTYQPSVSTTPRPQPRPQSRPQPRPQPRPSNPTGIPVIPVYDSTPLTGYPTRQRPTPQPTNPTPEYLPPSPQPRPQSRPQTRPQPRPQTRPQPTPEQSITQTPGYLPPGPQKLTTPRQYVPPSSTTPRPRYPSPSIPRPSTSREYLPPARPTYPSPSTPTTVREYIPPSGPTKRPQQVYPSSSSPQPRPPSYPSRPSYPSPSTSRNNYPSPSTVAPTTEREYLPPSSTVNQPSQGGYSYPTPTPSFEYPEGSSSFGVNNQYITPRPSQPNVTGAGTNTKTQFVRPQSSQPIPDEQGPPTACAAALKCVQEIYCTADGFISPVPVVLTEEQENNKVPTTVCQDKEAGIIGKCCRDPNYQDPWPSANLVDGVDDGQYKEDGSLGQYNPTKGRFSRSGQSRANSNSLTQVQSTGKCGFRHQNTQPKGVRPLDVNFAEIPWQAMILRDSNRSLLCGGAIIRQNAVLTTAHCLEGLDTRDVLVKGGEWKLGIDEEPLPFQIVKVSVILRHPEYQPGSLLNDLAILVLEEKLRLAKNIGLICLPQPNQIPTENCIATGWGKRILQLHARGAIMHSINVLIMDNRQCQETLSTSFQNFANNYSPNTLCGYSQRDQCKVDYGSALACTGSNNQYVLSGIYAWDTGCKTEGQIGGYIAPDVDWIETALAKPIRDLKQLEQEYLSSH